MGNIERLRELAKKVMSRKMLSRDCQLIDSVELRDEIEKMSNYDSSNVTVSAVYSSVNSILSIRLSNCPKMAAGLRKKLDKNKRILLKETNIKN